MIKNMLETVIPMRELKKAGEVDVPTMAPEVRYDYLTIYDQMGKVLARSNGHAMNSTIRLVYHGVMFIATPGHEDAEISIEFFGLSEQISKEEEYANLHLIH